jgi:hypothetical protein
MIVESDTSITLAKSASDTGDTHKVYFFVSITSITLAKTESDTVW